jgi:hypothetical protein
MKICFEEIRKKEKFQYGEHDEELYYYNDP